MKSDAAGLTARSAPIGGSAVSSDLAMRRLVEETASLYRGAGMFAWKFARGKLRRDPLYLTLLSSGLIPDGARVVDLGCGQGIPFALFLAADVQHRSGVWPEGWPPAPRGLRMLGIERRTVDVRRARVALGPHARVEQMDLRDARLQASDVIVLLDVLHYLPPGAQLRLLRQAVDALAPGGSLIVRVCDGAATFGALAARVVDRAVAFLRDRRRTPLHLRSGAEWNRLLERCGASVTVSPLASGMPFANVLLVARRRA